MEYQQADETQSPNQPPTLENIAATPVPAVLGNGAPSRQDADPLTTQKPGKKSLKETIRREAKEIAAIIVYLAISMSVLATLKCLILLQYGVNEFKNAYIMAIVSALALGKIIVLAQKLPIVNRMRHRPIFWACVYKACFFTILMTFVHHAEERFIHSSVDPNDVFPIAGVVCHVLSLFGIFFALFCYRDLDLELGEGNLTKLIFKSRKT
jgi:hypothetical protein